MGSPRPIGTSVATTSIIAPADEPDFRTSSKKVDHLDAASWSGDQKGLR